MMVYHAFHGGVVSSDFASAEKKG